MRKSIDGYVVSFSLLFLLVSGLLAVACSADKKSRSEGVSLVWQEVVYNNVSPLQQGNGRSVGSLTQQYTMLVPKDFPQLEREIVRVILGAREDGRTLTAILDSLAEAHRSHFPIASDVDAPLTLGEEIKTTLAYEDEKVVSLEVNFLTSANDEENHTTRCIYNFIIDEGTAFSEVNLFRDGYEKPLKELLAYKVESLGSNHIVNVDEARPNANFKVTAEGLVYAFQERLVAVNVEKPLEVLLRWEELRPLLREQSAISHLAP